jgi:hypothetical protein
MDRFVTIKRDSEKLLKIGVLLLYILVLYANYSEPQKKKENIPSVPRAQKRLEQLPKTVV